MTLSQAVGLPTQGCVAVERVRLFIDVELDRLGDPSSAVAGGWACFTGGELVASASCAHIPLDSVSDAAQVAWQSFYSSTARQLEFPF